mgnify:CR=1 FL=1
MCDRTSKQLGATLVELIVSILILSVSSVGIMMLITNVTSNSANPVIRAQATAILQAHMEEILAQPLNDPSDTETGGAESGETRATYDDVNDYDAISDTTGARDQSDAVISGLEGYNVKVDITDSALNGVTSKRIEVIVSYDADPDSDSDGHHDVKYRAVAHRVR